MLIRTLLLAAALTIGTAPALAQPKPQPNTSTGDPNERICEKVEIIGSRLASKRICATRAEWADRKRQDREALEAAQRGPCVRDGTSACK